jgi:hypothetical protein
MYNCSPENHQELDLRHTRKFLAQFDWSQINAFGFYGGEPSIDMPLYDRFIALVPKGIAKFVITNGTWSTDLEACTGFLGWCTRHQFHVIVSSTPEHIKHQNRALLEELARESGDGLELKLPDEIHAQGRAKGIPGVVNDCKMSCQRTDRNIRLGLKPNGDIIFQNCHGEYLIVQTYADPFATLLSSTQRIVSNCLAAKRAKSPVSSAVSPANEPERDES